MLAFIRGWSHIWGRRERESVRARVAQSQVCEREMAVERREREPVRARVAQSQVCEREMAVGPPGLLV